MKHTDHLIHFLLRVTGGQETGDDDGFPLQKMIRDQLNDKPIGRDSFASVSSAIYSSESDSSAHALSFVLPGFMRQVNMFESHHSTHHHHWTDE